MKKTLLKKNPILKNPRFYLGALILLFISTFSFAGTLNHVLNGTTLTAAKNANKDDITVKGKVTDHTTGETIPGATVKIKGTQVATVADVKGNFSIQAPSDAVLVFSFIGYDAVEIPVNGKTELNASLTLSNKNLNEVVVVGYGTQKKNAITAAVSTINTETIAQKPVPNLTNSLIGRASGVIVTQGSGEPGFDPGNIQIRGTGSIGGTRPLTIVDGVPRDFSLLDPNTVATISILKDAAAVAPYGVAGANGVILITTKQGKAGKASLTYNGYVGFQNPTRVPDFVNSYQYAQMRNEADVNDFNPNPFATAAQLQLYKDHSDPDIYSDGDPIKQIILPNRLITDHNITLSGGNDDVKYFASVGYLHQDGYWSTTYLDRYNGTLNLTAKASNTTTVGLNVSSYVQDGHYPGTGAGSIIDQAMRQAPTTPVYYSNGEWPGYIGQSLIGEIYHSGYALDENTALYTQLSIDQKLPIPGLSIKGVISYDNGPDPLFPGNVTSFNRAWNTPIPFYNATQGTDPTGPVTYTANVQGSPLSRFSETVSQNHTLTYQGLLNYNHSFGKSDISGVAVVEYKNVNYQTFTAGRIDYNLNIDELNYGGPLATDATNGGSSSGQKQIGYVYRLDYTYDKKYTFEGSGRYDGSYLFGPGHRFGFFPAFSASWRLSEEKFIKDNFTWIDNLKLRGSWGQSGAYPVSGNNIQTYQYLSGYNVSSNSGVIGGSATQGIYESLQGNPNITWEKSDKTDVGIEASLWKGVLGFEADYFLDKRSNMLIIPTGTLPGEYGVGLGPVNGGKMTNHGVDVTLTSFKKFSSDLRLDIKGTFTYARNKLLQVDESPGTYDNPLTRRTGRPNGTQFGLKAIGYFTAADFVDPNVANPVLKPGIPVPTYGTVRPGDIQYADLNHDGKIDNSNDIEAIGHPSTPEIIYGLEPRLTYKNFDLDILFQGSGNSDLYINNYFVWPFESSGSATELAYTDHWTPTHTDALYPRLSSTPTTNNTQESSWWIRNTAYIRMKSFELGYSFPAKMLGKTMHQLRVYVAGQNVFTWTPSTKEVLDPEEGGNNENYFQERVLSVGVNATF
jgi:TonB-linked SusC/RagA family outer membrane protein